MAYVPKAKQLPANPNQLFTNVLNKLDALDLQEHRVDLPTFLYDENYLNLRNLFGIELSERQYRYLEAADGATPEDTKYNEFVIVVGKGGGKDMCSQLLLLRAIYNLWTLGGADALNAGNEITCLNVALTRRQARDAFFKGFTEKLKKAPIFQKIGYEIKADEVLFPKGLRCLSGTSEVENMEGLSIYIGILDEISAFKTKAELSQSKSAMRQQHSADQLYDMIRSSMTSRFPHTGKLIMISYPRFKGDFILTKYEQYKKQIQIGQNPKVYLEFAATWEFNPRRKIEEFEKERLRDPAHWASRYNCSPPDTENAFIPNTQKVYALVNYKRRPPVDPMTGRFYPDFYPKGYEHTLGIDLGLTNDRAALVMAHKEEKTLPEGATQQIYVIDLLKTWKAPHKGEIDLASIRDFIISLRERGFRIGKGYIDRFASDQMRQELNARGFKIEKAPSIEQNLEVWNGLKDLINEGRLEYYDDQVNVEPNDPERKSILINELLGLSLIRGSRVDHLATGCFTGDTQISLCDGRELSLLGLVDEFKGGKINYVYSYNHNLQIIEPKKILKAWKTLENQPLVEVELDNGQKIRGTANHLFMDRDGSYVAMGELRAGQSLMPLYRRYPNKGKLLRYRMYYEPVLNTWHFEHRRFCNVSLLKGHVIHHVDFNSKNNSPTNLQQMTRNDHKALHNREQSDEERARRSSSVSAWHRQNKGTEHYQLRNSRVALSCKGRTPYNKGKVELRTLSGKLVFYMKVALINKMFNVVYGELAKSERSSYMLRLHHTMYPEKWKDSRRKLKEHNESMRGRSRGEAFKQQMSAQLKAAYANGTRKPAAFYKTREQMRESAKKTAATRRRNGSYGKKATQPVNHKVVKVTYLEEKQDVYDLEVEDNHNFALSAGVFVHNSKDATDALVRAIEAAKSVVNTKSVFGWM